MTDDKKAFELWLSGKMMDGVTRRAFAEAAGVKMEDLEWAFCAGYMLGKRDEREGK